MAVLGVDYGAVRIGLAVSDPSESFALPHSTVENTAKALALVAIAALEPARKINTIVVGEPLNMDGTPSPTSATARAFGEQLAQATGIEVVFYDERRTSKMAKAEMKAAGLDNAQIRAGKDSVAAQKMLQGYLDSRRLRHEGT